MLVALLAGCVESTGSYQVSTCAFGSADTTCTPVAVDPPKAVFAGSFALVDPNPGIAPGCAATVDLTVRSGTMEWYAVEQDPASCAEIGDAIEGNAAVGDGHTIDLWFPRATFTFRIEVDPS